VIPRLEIVILAALVAGRAAGRAGGEDVSPQPVAQRPEPADVMRWHGEGRQPRINVFSAQDSRRPLLGVHVYFDPAIKDLLPRLGDVFDFITQDDHRPWVTEALEAAHLPWVELFHNPIPVGRWDRGGWNRTARMGDRLWQIQQTHPYCLGFNTGSEPHFSPDYRYTGHTEAQVDSLITRPESSREFGDWMAGLYGDASPSEDSNADGITFAHDFGFSSDRWETVGTAMPGGSPFKRFLHTLFKEHLITQVIIGMDNNYHTGHAGKLVIVSRLLSIPYAPTFGQSLRQLKYPADAVGVTHYVFTQVGQKEVQGANPSSQLAVFDPGMVELAGGCIYQQALRTGRRPFYNEFQCGSPQGNTPDNIYRAVFHELQFKPAAINWFSFSAGKTWEWFNCHPISTELAVLRGQLELMSPYAGISRPQRDLAIFIPPANPDSTRTLADAMVEGEQWPILRKLAGDLTKFGPDVLLTEQLDKLESYRNLVLVLGYIDGPTDARLTKMLSGPPTHQRILVVCAKTQLCCEPGRRASRDFTHSLLDVLPISPMGGAATPVSMELPNGRRTMLSATATAHRNPSVKEGVWMEAGGRTVGWRQANLMVLAGIPEQGADALVEWFFGLTVPTMRRAGALRILNTNAVADQPGCYCLEQGQRLTIPGNLVGYDLPRRKPVRGSVQEPGVIWVLDPTRLRVVDAGTAGVRWEGENSDNVRLRISIPRFKFPKPVQPELVLVSPRTPAVSLNGQPLAATRIARSSFYLCPLTHDGTCVVGK
jgi:hypothetical protein